MRFLLRLLINAAALWVATKIVPGVTFSGEMGYLIVVALVFGLLNALVRPILTMLTCPLLILTLGLRSEDRSRRDVLRRDGLSDRRRSGLWSLERFGEADPDDAHLSAADPDSRPPI